MPTIKENPVKEGTRLSVAEESFLKIFCDKLFPGADFRYIKTIDKKHHFEYIPERAKQGTKEYSLNKSLLVELNENLLDFEVKEFNDAPKDYAWKWNSALRYSKLLAYNVYKAYVYLESIGAIEHHVVRKILKEPCVPSSSN